jgi:Skp family chaperone for outer membrane proteins
MKRIVIAVVLLTSTFSTAAAAQQRGAAPPAPAPSTQRPAPPATPGGAQTPPAQPAAPPQQLPFPTGAKVAFVNMQIVVQESKLGKAGREKMQALQTQNQTKVAPLSKQIQDKQQEINTKQGVVSDAALQTLRRDLERIQLEAQTAQQKAQADEQNLNEDLLRDFSEKAAPILEAIRTEKELWVIFGVQEDGNGAGGQLIVASANGGLDLSMEVVKRMDAKYPTADAK